jgi:hypothetical protein
MNWSDIAKRLKKQLEEFSKLAWILILSVAVASLCVVISSYRLTLSGTRPRLSSFGSSIKWNQHPETVALQWVNVGSRTGREGIAVVFVLSDDGTQKREIGSAPIRGNGTTLIPTFVANADIIFEMNGFLGSFLVCATYVDDSGTPYEQVFHFKPATPRTQNEAYTPLDELPPPGDQLCH